MLNKAEHILYVGPDYKNHKGGIGAVLAVYARHIRPFKFVPTYVTGGRGKQTLAYFGALARTARLLATDRSIKIVHIHMASRGSFLRKSIVYGLSRLFGKKVFVHVHGAEFHQFYAGAGPLRPFIRKVIRGADEVICLSHKWKAFFEEQFPGCRTRIINNIVELPADGPVPAAPARKKLRMLFLGFIGERKGIFDLLQLIANNRDAYEGRLELVVGGNGETTRLQSFIHNHELGELVDYKGWVSGPQKEELLRQCDVYILPSYNEGLPISVLEAMAAGKPVISTYAGGIPEVVQPGENGWLFEAGDLDALDRILLEALASPERIRAYGQRSLELIGAYAPEEVTGQLEHAYTPHIA